MSAYDDTVERRARAICCPGGCQQNKSICLALASMKVLTQARATLAADDAAGYWLVPKQATEEMTRAAANTKAMQHYGVLAAQEAEAAFGEPVDSSLIPLQTAFDSIVAANAAGAVKEEE